MKQRISQHIQRIKHSATRVALGLVLVKSATLIPTAGIPALLVCVSCAVLLGSISSDSKSTKF